MEDNDPLANLYGLHLGDHKELAKLIPDESIDVIFTDPPYPREYDHVFGEMAEYAMRVLKPGGSLLTLCGHYQLQTVMQALSNAGLTYHWLAWQRSTKMASLFGYRIVCTGKPMLWFTKGPKPKKVYGFFWDSFFPNRIEKLKHKWQQPVGWATSSLKNLTKEGDVVLEPFAGGGTVPCACIALNRKWIAFELDPAAYEISRNRIDAYYVSGIVETMDGVEPLDKSQAIQEYVACQQTLFASDGTPDPQLLQLYAESGLDMSSQLGPDLPPVIAQLP